MIDKERVESWHVLLVDDEPDNLEVAVRVLEFHGATTYSATDGLEGLATLRRIKPTFVLLDLSMPQMDGWEMLHRVKDNPETATLPVIALTAHAMTGDEGRAMEAGFDGYITKPFNPLTLLDDLCKTLLTNGNSPNGAKSSFDGQIVQRQDAMAERQV